MIPGKACKHGFLQVDEEEHCEECRIDAIYEAYYKMKPAFEAMREALRDLRMMARSLPPATFTSHGEAMIAKSDAALALADKVSK